MKEWKNEAFYTEDFDQEMLDYIEDNYDIWQSNFLPFTINSKNTLLRHSLDDDFIVTRSRVGINLTKQQFKEKIGMTEKDENTLTKDMLKTGMIVEHKGYDCLNTDLAMVLLDTANGDIISGETWSPLDESVRHIVKVYQPRSNMHFLNDAEGFKAGLNLEGCELIWERKSPEQLEIDKLQAEVDERLKRITELKENM